MNNIIYSLDRYLDNYISHVNEISRPILSDLIPHLYLIIYHQT